MSYLLAGGSLHDRISAIYVTSNDAIKNRRELMKKDAEPVEDAEDSWPPVLKVLEWMYMFSWILSWLAAFSAMELARKHHEGVHNSNFATLDTLTPLFISCQKACRWPQKVFEATEAARVHSPGHPRFRKRLAYLMSTTIKLVLWSAAAFYTWDYWYVLVAFYVLMVFATITVVRMTMKEEDWPALQRAVEMEVRATTGNMMQFTRLKAESLRY